MADLEVSNIKKNYKKKIVLRDITFGAGTGTCIGILGGNGCGKSTLLSILAGITPADGGRFLWKGKDLLSDPAERKKTVGYIPQGTPLFEELSAYDNLRLWYNRESLERELSDGILKTLGIDEFLRVRVSKMSGGMKKRLSIGCAMASHPELLLLDEPSTALDLVCKAEILDYFKKFRNEGGTIIIATHDLREIEMCDILYILKDGTLTSRTYDGDADSLVEYIK